MNTSAQDQISHIHLPARRYEDCEAERLTVKTSTRVKHKTSRLASGGLVNNNASISITGRTYKEIAHCDGTVGIDDKAVGTERCSVFELGGYEHADGSQQLQLRATNGQYRQDTVEVVDGQREHFILALLLSTDLYSTHTAIKIDPSLNVQHVDLRQRCYRIDISTRSVHLRARSRVTNSADTVTHVALRIFDHTRTPSQVILNMHASHSTKHWRITPPYVKLTINSFLWQDPGSPPPTVRHFLTFNELFLTFC